MEASKISFTEKTQAQLQSPVISKKKKRDLRRAIMLEEIRRRPVGTMIRTRDLADAAGFTGGNSQNTYAFLKRMERDNLITIEKVPKSDKKIYTVVADSRTVVPKVEKPAPEQHEIVTNKDKTLGEYAKEFAWKKNSDSLREFVGFMDGIELDLRRQIQGGGSD